jgi:hypothetical protein
MEVDLWARGTAVYGAVLSTLLGLYALRKDRVKVRVGAYYELTSDAGATRLSALIVRVTNVGRRSVTVKGVYVREGKEKRFITLSTRQGNPSNTLEPTREIDHRYEPALVTERTTKLGVFDTEEREWALSRKLLKNLKRGAASYRQAHM